MRKNIGVKPWFYPLPVLIIATYNEDGSTTAMNAAWGGLYDQSHVILCLSENHKTVDNIKRNHGFTIGFATSDTVVESDYLGLVSANQDLHKFDHTGMHSHVSPLVNAPIIDEYPLVLECELHTIQDDGHIIGTIKGINVDETILDDDNKIDMIKFHPLSYEPSHNKYHAYGIKVADAFSVGNQLK